MTGGAPVGWPRPDLPCRADDRCDSDGCRRHPPTRPAQWVSEIRGGKWDPWEFNPTRASLMREHDLCQACGLSRGDQVYVLATEYRRGTLVEMFGGALCSLKCARRTAVHCPSYRSHEVVEVYVVPKHERVDLIGVDVNNDDEYDIEGLQPVLVVNSRPLPTCSGGED